MRFILFAILHHSKSAWVCAAYAQEGPLTTDPPKGITAEQIVQKFTAKEKEFKNARKRCTYRQSVKFQTLQGTEVNSDYEQVADVRLDEAVKSKERGVRAAAFHDSEPRRCCRY